MSKDTWCVLPWVHLCIRTDNTLKPCCRFLPRSDEDNLNFDEIEKHGVSAMNTDVFQELRKNMLENKPTAGCQKCYSQEAKGSGSATSMRQFHNNRWKDIKRENCTEKFEHVKYIEMSVDNICNLQCKMCDSKFSSKLINRDKFLGNPVYKKLEPSFNKLDSVDLSQLRMVKILGGEPFITPNFPKFIDYLIERADVSKIVIDIATNATAIPSESLIEKLNKFAFININISLDAYDTANDYQRVGSNYIETYENSLKYRQILKHADFSYHITTSLLTANKLGDTLSFLRKNGQHYSVDFVRHPEHLSLLYAPKSYIKWVIEKNAKDPIAATMLRSIGKENNFDESRWKEFLNSIITLDKYYNMSLKDYNNDLYQYLIDNNFLSGVTNDN